MNEEEVEYEGWPGAGDDTVLVLDDGTRVYASCDPEGNMPGALFVRPKAETVYSGGLYLAVDEDDIKGSLEVIACMAEEALQIIKHPAVNLTGGERCDVFFETPDETVARKFGHVFYEMLLPDAEKAVPTPWAREHSARVDCVEKCGVA